jgi:hypothetical protein
LVGLYGYVSALSQTLATTPGAAYLLSFWLNNPAGNHPNQFSVSWDGRTVWGVTNFAALGWTNVQVTVAASGSSAALQFTFEPSVVFGLDDVSVYASATNTITNLSVSLEGSLAFGVVPIGLSATNTMTISNAGNATLTVNSISYPNGDFSGNWLGGQIGAGESQPVTVTFSPTSATNYDGTVTIYSDATSGTNTTPFQVLGLTPTYF